MTPVLNTVIYPVTDLAKAKAMYGALLGVAPYIDEPYYVGFRVAGQEVGLDPNGHQRGAAPVSYWQVPDIAESFRRLVESGAQPQQPPTDVGGGKLTATLKDPDGNVTGLVQMPWELFCR